MAQRKQKDMLSRLAETGEEALHKLADLPGGTKVLEAGNALRERVDDLTKKVRSLDPLERRVAELEKRLEQLSPAAKKPAAKKPTAAKKPAATRKRPT